MQRMLVGTGVSSASWVVDQEGRYRYNVSIVDGCDVRIVINEYLAARAYWNWYARVSAFHLNIVTRAKLSGKRSGRVLSRAKVRNDDYSKVYAPACRALAAWAGFQYS